MLKELAGIKRVVLICGRSDLRRGITGLSTYIRLNYGLDPLEEGTLFLFCGNKRDRIKGLLYEEDRFCLMTVRLVDGVFQWPRNTREARNITKEQYRLLMEGFTLEGSVRGTGKRSQ